MAKKRERKRVAKEDRKSLRGWADGARETILAPHQDKYAIAMEQGWRQERKYLKTVCLEFNARVDWRTGDYEEATIKDWDPTAVVAKETLSEDEEKQKRARLKVLESVRFVMRDCDSSSPHCC
jgi:hypothetical protein